jgi:hypothetical protein
MLECNDNPEDAPCSNAEIEKKSFQGCDGRLCFNFKLPGRSPGLGYKKESAAQTLRFCLAL